MITQRILRIVTLNKRKRNKIIKSIISIIVLLIICAAAYVGYIWVSYERIPDKLYLETNLAGSFSYFEDAETINKGNYYNIMTYNIGFGAYNQDYSFFMDGGKYSWAMSEDAVLADISGITDVINRSGVDFILLQEVDVDGTRSYHINELDLMNQFLKGYYYNSAVCYDTKFLLYPVFQPHGANKSVIATYSKFPIADAIRRSLPVPSDFSKLFDLDRCYTLTRIPTANENMLCLYNVHMSAYTDDVSVKDSQLSMLLNDMENEYKAGNYVVCGGDFNMDLKNTEVDHDYSWGAPFPRNRLPKGLTLGMDVSKDSAIEHNSCRNANEPYNENTTFTITTDGFIVSDNIKVNYYNNANWKYEFSDHDPVVMQIILQ